MQYKPSMLEKGFKRNLLSNKKKILQNLIHRLVTLSDCFDNLGELQF